MRLTLAFLVLAAGAAQAQLPEEYKPVRTNCCLQSAAQSLADQLQDWNQLGRYYADNVAAPSHQRPA